MKLIDVLVGVAAGFPSIGLRSDAERFLKKLYENANPEGYVSLSFLLAFIVAAVAGIFGLLLLPTDLLIALAILLFLFAFVFLFLLKLPELEWRRKVAEMEAELPLLLRMVGVLVNLGIPFTTALKSVAREKSQLALEINMVAHDIDLGYSVQKALLSLASRMETPAFKRAVSQMVTVYEHGGSGDEIKRIGDELLAIQQARLAESASRSTLFGLLFIVSSAILPTFFLVFAAAGRFAFSLNLSEETVALAFLLFFPLLNFLLFLLLRAQLPVMIFQRKEEKMDFIVLLFPLIFLVSFFIPYETIRLGVIAGGIALGTYLFYARHKEERRVEEMENLLPDALFAASGLPKGTGLDKIFEFVEKGGFGPISEEAGIAVKQIKARVKPGAVLESVAKRSGSEAVCRVVEMISHAYETGSDLSTRLHEMGEDLLRLCEIKRARANALAMQKYTLLFGAFLIPMILAMAIGLSNSMASVSGTGSNSGMLGFVVPVYLIIYAVFAAYYAAECDGKRSLLLGYFMLMACSSLIVFYLFGGYSM